VNLQTAEVVAVDSAQLIVDVETSLACARCAAGKGCGAGLLGGAGQTRRITVPYTNGLRLRRGDRVLLTLHPAGLLRASLIAYGFPLFGTILALLLGNWLRDGLSDADAVLLAIIGLVSGLLAGRHKLKQTGCPGSMTPTISQRLPPADEVGAADDR
jgi:sigma-E factor negative regulatory protein RseC